MNSKPTPSPSTSHRNSRSQPNSNECQFFYKVGACRHYERCIRAHTLPSRSTVLMIESIIPSSADQDEEKYLNTIRELFIEIALIKPIKEIVVSANTSLHLQGCILVSFNSFKDAETVLTKINSRYFAGKPVVAHYLPSGQISYSLCREGDSCRRTLDCSYVHPKELPTSFWKELFSAQLQQYQ